MMCAQPQIVVRYAPDLWQALRRRGVVTLQLPFIDSQLQAATEKRFNFWRRVCGCHIGALLLLATLALRIPSLLRAPEWTWSVLATEAGIVLLAALGGKSLAIIGARMLLAVDIAIFLRRLRHGALNAGED